MALAAYTLHNPAPSLSGVLWPSEKSAWLRPVALAVVGSLLLTVSAKLQVPMWPVPMTFQTLVVLALGVALGPWQACAAILLYLAQGAFGLPVFAAGGGFAYLIGPTGGYLVGFIPAAILCGYLARLGYDRNFLTTGLAMIAGNIVIYALGLAWLGGIIGYSANLLVVGLFPFLGGDVLKIILATAAFPLIWRFLSHR